MTMLWIKSIELALVESYEIHELINLVFAWEISDAQFSRSGITATLVIGFHYDI